LVLSLSFLVCAAATLPADADAAVERYALLAQAPEQARPQRSFAFSLEFNAWYAVLKGDIVREQAIQLDDLDLGTGTFSPFAIFFESAPVGDDAVGEWSGFADLRMWFGNVGFRLESSTVETATPSTLLRSVTFGGVTFQDQEAVFTRFDYFDARALFLWRFLEKDAIALALQAGFVGVNYSVSLSGLSGTGADTATVVLPELGLLFEWRTRVVRVEVELSGFSASYDGEGGTILDFRASGVFRFLKVMVARVGWRYTKVDVESGGFGFNGAIDGPYFSIGFVF
jgi:hypothetical protein